MQHESNMRVHSHQVLISKGIHSTNSNWQFMEDKTCRSMIQSLDAVLERVLRRSNATKPLKEYKTFILQKNNIF